MHRRYAVIERIMISLHMLLLCRCRGVNYNRRNGYCDLFDQLDGTGHPNGDTDFYRNLCNKRNQLESASSSAPLKKPDFVKEPLGGIKKPIDPFRTRFAPPIVVDTEEEAEEEITDGVDDTDRQFVVSKSIEEKTPNNVQPIPASLQVRPSPVEPSAVPVMIGAESVLTICNFEGIKFQVIIF